MNIKMEKVIRDGNVAVLYSPGYGAGWYTWHSNLAAVFHPRIVALVEADLRDEITEDLMIELFGVEVGELMYLGGAENLKIEWIEEGTEFDITEDDGSESICFRDQSTNWLGA